MSDIAADVKLSSSFDKSGTDAAASGLRQTQGAAEDLKTSTVDLAAAGETLKKAFIELFAVAKIVEWFKDGITEAMHYETAMRQLSNTAKLYGQDSAGVTDKIKKAAESFRELAGVAEHETIPAMAKFYQITGDPENAVRLTQLAVAIHMNAAGGLSFEEALGKVNAAAHGQARAVKDLLPIYDTQGDKFTDAATLLKELHKKYGDVTKIQGTLQLELAKSNAAWDEVKERLANEMLPTTTKAVNWFHALGPSFLAFARSMSTAFGMMFDGAVHLAAAAGLLASGHLDGAKAAWGEFTKSQEEGRSKIAKINEDAKNDIQRILGEIKSIVDPPGGDGPPSPLGGPKKAKEASLRRMSDLEAELRHAEAVEQKLDKEFEAGVNKRLAEAQHELTENEKFADQKLAAMLHEIEAEERADKAAHVAKMQRRKEEFQGTVDVANASIKLGTELFGQNKELATAQAIVSTYQAAAGALAAQPVGWWNIALAALMIVEGLVQVAKIQSTEPAGGGSVGAGFDDPSNDRAAYMGGRKWANDMIQQFTGGAASVSAGWSSGMGGSTTNDNSRTTVINVSGGLIDPNSKEWMKQFGRRLAVVMQADGQRVIARRT